jgi:hypothetical protein
VAYVGCADVPAIVCRANAVRTKYARVVPPTAAVTRVPASRLDGLPASIGWPSNQMRATPAFDFRTEHDARTDARSGSVAPDGAAVAEPSATAIVSSTA